jgi:phosphatidylserine/phosphatidylglycerophosphate/cardiolipin synthase-like enzyme
MNSKSPLQLKASPLNLLVFSLILSLLLTACEGGFTSQSDSSETHNNQENQGSNSSEHIQVFFSKLGSNNGGPENQLINAINHATSSIDMAIYELNLTNVSDSLIKAHQRGITVRVLTDSDHLTSKHFIKLTTNGITVKGDKRRSLMHNKFTVIDNKEVWTGSMNLTFTGAYRHRNNLIHLNSSQAAISYSEEFSQLWAGVHNQTNATNNYFSVSSIPVDIHFSPDDNFRSARLIPLLQQTQQSVHMLAFAFTSQEIASELVSLKQQGIEVKIVVDSGQSGQSSSQYDDLRVKKLDIRRDGQAYKLHHKVIIIDGRYVVTGSYNFSENAESRNDENSVVIDSSTIADSFEAEFADVYSHAINKPALRRLSVKQGF